MRCISRSEKFHLTKISTLFSLLSLWTIGPAYRFRSAVCRGKHTIPSLLLCASDCQPTHQAYTSFGAYFACLLLFFIIAPSSFSLTFLPRNIQGFTASSKLLLTSLFLTLLSLFSKSSADYQTLSLPLLTSFQPLAILRCAEFSSLIAKQPLFLSR